MQVNAASMLEKVMQQIYKIIKIEFQKRDHTNCSTKTNVENMYFDARQQPQCNPVTRGGVGGDAGPKSDTRGTKWGNVVSRLEKGPPTHPKVSRLVYFVDLIILFF